MRPAVIALTLCIIAASWCRGAPEDASGPNDSTLSAWDSIIGLSGAIEETADDSFVPEAAAEPLLEFGDLAADSAAVKKDEASPGDSVPRTIPGFTGEFPELKKGRFRGIRLPSLPRIRFKKAITPGLVRTAGRIVVFVLFAACVVVAVIVFTAMARKKVEKGRFMTTTRLSVMNKEVQRACRHIEKNYADPGLTVESLCSAIITGVAFLEALFERELGMSVTDFIDQVRINRARELYRADPGIDIDILVRQSGYADKPAFFAAFKKATGVSFNEFRLSAAPAPGT
jgi:AraC-like DNA-binding protein